MYNIVTLNIFQNKVMRKNVIEVDKHEETRV